MMENDILKTIARLLLAVVMGMWASGTDAQTNERAPHMLLYVGTYTTADSQGIELYRFDAQSAKLHFVKTFAGIANPSYLRFSADGKFLYAVNELLNWNGKAQGAFTAFAVRNGGSELQKINQISSQGRAPCFLTLSDNDRFVLLNNYLDGTILSVKIRPDGGLDKVVTRLHFTGSGPVKGRQDDSHVHSVTLNPQNTFAVVADLGTDRLSVLAFDANTGMLTLLKKKTAHTAPGAGPRHAAFSADGNYLYVANELNSTVEAFSFNPQNGSLEHLQTLSTLPHDFTGENYPADIHLSPDGRFLYVSNRGHESIAVFTRQASNGQLRFLSTTPVHGSWPRNFTLTPDGKYLVVANQRSKNLVVFRRHSQNGTLEMASAVATVAAPACVTFRP
jgi:6-phosphogluconolactonase